MTPAVSRRALVIGINEYPSLADSQQLQGCVNDATAMATLLTDRFGFPSENVTLLPDPGGARGGTRKEILASFKELAQVTQPGDEVVVFFAGHGSQLMDASGDESDALDEVIFPSDCRWGKNPSRFLRDDELAKSIAALTARGARLTVLFDSCHSGTVDRDPVGSRARTVPRVLKKKTSSASTAAASKPGASLRNPTAFGSQYVILSACRSDEQSREVPFPVGEEFVRHGVFTWHLIAVLQEAPQEVTWRKVLEDVQIRMGRNGAQHPVGEGAVDRVVFGEDEHRPDAHARILGREGARVELSVGAAHGVRVGARWEVHHGGALSRSDGKALAEVTVTAVSASGSQARVDRESQSRAVDKGMRAFPLSHPGEDEGLRVAVVADPADPGAQALSRRISKATWLRLTPFSETADLRVVALPARETVGPADPVPSAGPLAQPVWVVVDREGLGVMPRIPRPDGDGVEAVLGGLERLARHRTLLGLHNPDPQGRLSKDVSARFLTGSASLLEKGGAEVVKLVEGEPFAFEVISTRSQPVYVTILDAAEDGSVALVDDKAQGGVAPSTKVVGRTLLGGGGDGEGSRKMRMALSPEDWPFSDPLGRDAQGMDGAFVVLVTEEPAEFSFLLQPAATERGIPEGLNNSLEKWAAQALFTGGSRKGVSFDGGAAADAQQDWAVFSVPYRVLRKGSEEAAKVIEGRAGARRALLGAVQRAAAQEGMALLAQCSEGDSWAGSRTPEVRGGEGGQEVWVPSSPGECAQVLLVQDRSGAFRWVSGREGGTRGEASGGWTFTLPTSSVGTRGPLEKGIFQVFGVPLTASSGGGGATPQFAAEWEAAFRPSRLMRLVRDAGSVPRLRRLDAADWPALQGGRSLLLLHGTFQQTWMWMEMMPVAMRHALLDAYAGRVFAFDHPSMSVTPSENAAALVRLIPPGANLDLDILSYSRGGLVGRELVERPGTLSLGNRQIRVGKLVFGATPNRGTPLATPSQTGSFLDLFTNLLAVLPGADDTLRAMVAAVKTVAASGVKDLPGLHAMAPGGPYLTGLNQGGAPSGTRYLGLAANFEISFFNSPFWDVVDEMIDSLMILPSGVPQENDLVVPTASVHESNGQGAFPLPPSQKVVFSTANRVGHHNLFSHFTTEQALGVWLNGGP